MIQDKQKDESYVTFAKRVTDAYENRLIDIDEWGEMIFQRNKERLQKLVLCFLWLKMMEKRLGKKLIYLINK